MAVFKVQIKFMWNTEVGEFEIFAEEEEESIEDEDDAVKQVWLLPAFKQFFFFVSTLLNSANIGKNCLSCQSLCILKLAQLHATSIWTGLFSEQWVVEL